MRKTTATTTGPSALQLQVEAPEALALMYSPQRVIVTATDTAPSNTAVAVTVQNTASGQSYTEKRAFYQGVAEFDIARPMQLLAPPISNVLTRVDFGGPDGLTEPYELRVELVDTDGRNYTAANYEIRALYGALDGGETYGKKTSRRLWVNLPQTFTVNRSYNGVFAIEVAGQTYTVPGADTAQKSAEADIVQAVLAGGGSISQLAKAKKLAARVSNSYALTDNNASIAAWRDFTLTPDTCPADAGVYLRWLNREGGVSYWMFQRSQSRTTAAVHNSFEVYLPGAPAAPVSGIYRNTRRADYREARELILGAIGLSSEEHAELCTLATSPAVEMLVLPDDYTGGRIDGPQKWVQVTVTAGTYERDIRRTTPSRQDLEFIIELPERNTARL